MMQRENAMRCAKWHSFFVPFFGKTGRTNRFAIRIKRYFPKEGLAGLDLLQRMMYDRTIPDSDNCIEKKRLKQEE